MYRTRYTEESLREMRRLRQRRSDRRLLMLLLVVGLLGVMAAVLGRGFFSMQEVADFAATLHQKSPQAIKQELDRYARRLHSSNPIVRNAAIAAMRTATGEDFGGDVEKWTAWWRANEPTWEYKPSPQTSTP